MKTKIVYVLVSQESDYYYEMFLLSHYSLRLYHPIGDAEVVLVMDKDTNQRLCEKKASVLNDVTPIVVDVPDEYTIMQRSRYLKTSLRNLVNGDFLYLDVDTIICGRIASIDKVEADIAMVSDCNTELSNRNDMSIYYCEKAGFTELDGEPYFNAGVILAKDNNRVCSLFNEWHYLWKISLKNNVPQDQPALCQANRNLNYPVRELSYIWNCMIVQNPLLKKIKIRHYFVERKSICKNLFLDYVKTTGNIQALDNMLRHPQTIFESALLISEERLMKYLCSQNIYLYESTPNIYNRLSVINSILSMIYISISNIKKMVIK